MSTIVVLKEADSIVLGTDSRYVTADRSRVVSDSVEKIQEIAAGTFLATSGYAPVCDFQNAKARELGQSTQDIRTLSGMLAEASRPVLEEVAATLAKDIRLHPVIGSAVTGETVFHGAVLAGHSCGELGYIYMESRYAGGRAETRIEEYFGAPRRITITSATDSGCLARLRNDWRLWSDPPLTVVSAILETEKRVSSAIGGPNQIVRLNSTGGSRWISRLPAAIRQATCPSVGIGTITAAISMTAPTLIITGSGFTMNVDSSNALLLTSSAGGSIGTTIQLNPTTFSIVLDSGTNSGNVEYPNEYITTVSPGDVTIKQKHYSGSWSQVAVGTYVPTGLACGPTGTELQLFSTGVFQLSNLPSSSPGAGSKQFWYDPSDSNRVKFAA